MCYVLFFFFKQKTAYEMRISDWSSDVCSSDLRFGALIAMVYFGNVQLQTWLGKRALEQTDLQFLGIEQGLAQGRREHKPVLVDFSAIWGGNCRVMHQTLFTDATVKQVLNRNYVLVRVDYEDRKSVV